MRRSPRQLLFFVVRAAVWCAVAAPVVSLPAAPTNAPAAAAGASASFVVPTLFVAPAVPPSVFIQPKKPAQGRDPFFPRSTRIWVDPATKPVAPVAPVAELFLKGISGTEAVPLAIVNDVTFGKGDELEVVTKAGRMKIRCLEINMATGTVTVQLGGERRELRLASAPVIAPVK